MGVAESGERKSQILSRCKRPLVYWEKETTRKEKAEIEENTSIRSIGRKRAEKLEGIQPAILVDFPQAAKRKFRASGLFARFFPVYPLSNIGRRNVRKRVLIADELQAAYDRAVMDLLDIELIEGKEYRLELDTQARELWLGFAEEMEKGQADGGEYRDLRDWVAKLPGGALRLAGLFHLAEHGKQGLIQPVNFQTMASAVGLAMRLIDHARAVFGLVGADKTTDDAKAVWAWIVENQMTGFFRSDAHKRFHTKFGKVEVLEEVLDVLKGRELIHGPYKSKQGKGNRPSHGYTVNPAALLLATHQGGKGLKTS